MKLVALCCPAPQQFAQAEARRALPCLDMGHRVALHGWKSRATKGLCDLLRKCASHSSLAAALWVLWCSRRTYGGTIDPLTTKIAQALLQRGAWHGRPNDGGPLVRFWMR